MDTVTELLGKLAETIKGDGSVLLTQHSVSQRHPPQDRYDPVFVIRMGSHYWQPLGVEGKRAASLVRGQYERFHAIVQTLTRKQPRQTQHELKNHRAAVMRLINQTDDHSHANGADAHSAFCNEIDKHLALLQDLHDTAEGDHIYVPDTNALIYNPALEDWEFDGSPRFVLMLTPTVMSELDQLKVVGRVDSLRDKAQRLVKQLMEYRRRGNLNDGVTLRSGRSQLRTFALEPDFGDSLPWLDRENADDRILAAFVEIMRQHPRCPVTLVTRDINLANKADYARRPCTEPPEPSAKES